MNFTNVQGHSRLFGTIGFHKAMKPLENSNNWIKNQSSLKLFYFKKKKNSIFFFFVNLFRIKKNK
jgi:hypothetical protein